MLARLSRARLLARWLVWSASEPVLSKSAVIDGEQCSLALLVGTHPYLGDIASQGRRALRGAARRSDERHGHEPVADATAQARLPSRRRGTKEPHADVAIRQERFSKAVPRRERLRASY